MLYNSIENSEIPFVIGEMRAISNDDYFTKTRNGQSTKRIRRRKKESQSC